ncbi:hypothetical protein ACH54D_20515 [Atlantibacter hermannii]|uniref:hypothetical protein n=1 Tax=Atlantibacter hermannii TaxID=565 RepID=UPI003251400B
MSHYETEYLKPQLIEAAQRVIEAGAVNIFPDTPAHRQEQLNAIVETLKPEDWLAILKP